MNKALLLDLDGTVRRTTNGKPCPNRPEEQELIPGVKEVIKKYKSQGFKIIGITNQGGIGMGYMSEEDNRECLYDLNERLDFMFDHIYYAPAKPSEKHPDTKPNPGMILKARDKFNLDLDQSVMVGDRDTDEQAAQNAGVPFQWAKEFFK